MYHRPNFKVRSSFFIIILFMQDTRADFYSHKMISYRISISALRSCMKKLQKIKISFSRISLVDKFLLLFLFLLLAQIAYGMFTKTESSAQINSIDVIIRTFASAVFGYFLSGRFSDTLPRGNTIPAISQNTPQTDPAAPFFRAEQNRVFRPAPRQSTLRRYRLAHCFRANRSHIPNSNRCFRRTNFPDHSSHPAQYFHRHRYHDRTPHTAARYAFLQHRLSYRT